MNCPKCGSEIETQDKFCSVCGEKISVIEMKNNTEETSEKKGIYDKIINIDKKSKELNFVETNIKNEDISENKKDILGLDKLKEEIKLLKKELKIKTDNLEQFSTLKIKISEKEDLEKQLELIRDELETLEKNRNMLKTENELLLQKNETLKEKEEELIEKEKELAKLETTLNDKNLELLSFQEELLVERKKIKENELSMFLSKELGDKTILETQEFIDDDQKQILETNDDEKALLILLETGQEFLEKNYLEAAKNIYSKIQETFSKIQKTHSKERLNSLRLQIMDYYNDLYIKLIN